MRLTIEQKQDFINENLEQFFTSPKTSSEEYKNNFNAMDVEKQYAVVLRWKKYNERKNNQGAQTSKKSISPVDYLMAGEMVEMNTEDAMNMIERFKVAIETCEKIIESNKVQEKEELEEQLKAIQARLKELK